MKRLVVLSGYGVYLRVRKGLFQVVKKGSKPEEIPPVEVDAIIVDTKAASISSSAVLLAAKLGVDILFYDGWRPAARLLPAAYGSTLKTWVKQLHAAKKRRVELARSFAHGKIYNQRQVLYRVLKTKPARKLVVRATVRDAVNTATSVLTRLGDGAGDKTARSPSREGLLEGLRRCTTQPARLQDADKALYAPQGRSPGSI